MRRFFSSSRWTLNGSVRGCWRQTCGTTGVLNFFCAYLVLIRPSAEVCDSLCAVVSETAAARLVGALICPPLETGLPDKAASV